MLVAEPQEAAVARKLGLAVVTRIDKVADALRLKDAEHRSSPVVAWPYLTDVEKAKWRDLALTAVETWQV